MVFSKYENLTRLGHVLLMLLVDYKEIYFPKTKEEMLLSDYSEEWKILIKLECVDFIDGLNGQETCCLVQEAYFYANCLAFANRQRYHFYLNKNPMIPTNRHYKNLQIIGALNYLFVM